MDIKELLINKAKQNKKRIIFPEADFSERIVNAGKIICEQGIAEVIFVGNKKSLESKINNTAMDIKVYDPNDCQLFDAMVNHVVEKRKSKGLTPEDAKQLLGDPIYFAVTLTDMGYADGMVCGAEVATARTLRPALQIIKGKKSIVSSYFLFVGKNCATDDCFMMGDCAVVEDPTSEEEKIIADLMLEENQKFGLFEPRFAFLSYSTYGSAKSDSVTKVAEAYSMFKSEHPKVQAIGEVQFDASVSKRVAEVKMPNIDFNFPANVFVMPNINAGNIAYKVAQYFGNLTAIGPITIGFNKPVNDLSRGCTVDDIVLVTAITSIQCN